MAVGLPTTYLLLSTSVLYAYLVAPCYHSYHLVKEIKEEIADFSKILISHFGYYQLFAFMKVPLIGCFNLKEQIRENLLDTNGIIWVDSWD